MIAAVVSIELRRTSDWTIRITELSICRLLSYHIFVVWENNPSPCGYCFSPSMVFVVWENNPSPCGYCISPSMVFVVWENNPSCCGT